MSAESGNEPRRAELRPSVRRESELTRLTRLLEAPGPGLSVCGISGPGGVGKSYLLAQALESVDLDALGVLLLSVDAANPQMRGDFFGILEQLFRRSLDPKHPHRDYFPHLRKVAGLHRELEAEVAGELARDGASEEAKKVVLGLLKAGLLLNSALPRSPALGLSVARAVLRQFDSQDAEALIDEAWARGSNLKALAGSSSVLRKVLWTQKKDRVRRELFTVTAEELMVDLRAIFADLRGDSRLKKLAQRPIAGARRLVLVIDDYEILNPLLGDFLVGSLVPELGAAGFETVLFVLCRDDLESTHVGWAQHCKRFVKEQVRVLPFDEAAAQTLMREAGVEESRRGPLFAATQGYPFLLSLLIEESASGEGSSALFLRKFIDRTTRWMSPLEQEWFVRICYLERVDEDTLKRLFPAEAVPRIQDWFEKEPSIRDPSAAWFRVRPLIRDKVLRYQELRAPSRHRELTALAAGPSTEG